MSVSTEYVLLASVFYQRQQGGKRVRYQKGDIVTGLSDGNARRLLKIRAIALPGDVKPEPEPKVEVESAGPNEAGAASKPTGDDNKPVLVDWVHDNVAKEDGSDYSKSELNRMIKDELLEIIESVE